MRIIDILNKIADGTLEDRFRFIYKNETWKYYKLTNYIRNQDEEDLEYQFNIYDILTDKVEVIEDVKEIKRIDDDIGLKSNEYDIQALGIKINKCEDKINELVRVVNELRKKDY